MLLLVVAFTSVAVIVFWRSLWGPTLLPAEGVIAAKSVDPSGYFVIVKHPDNRQSRQAVSEKFYTEISEGEKVVKPFLYSKLLRATEGREMAPQVQDLFILLVGILLFLFTAVCGNSFVAVLYVSLFLHEARKGKNGNSH